MTHPFHRRDTVVTRFTHLTFLTLLTFVTLLTPLRAATLPAGFVESQYGSDLGTGPTAMEFAPDGRLFVCLQGGALRVIVNGTLLPTPFVTVPTVANGERGLLGVTFDPDFATNHYVYVYYTVSTAPVHNRVSRYTANGNVAAGSETMIVDLDNLSSATNHNGGAIHFGADGKLYIAVGENGNAANSQSLSNRLGKILRLNPDGTIPADNPTTFQGIVGSPTGNNRAIWAVGFRNPFTFAFQPGTGRLFINDVGEVTWEEINDGIAGSNYGWSICEGFCNPPNANYRDPLFVYGHGGGNTVGCAIVGGAFYNPPAMQFPASFTDKYFFGDLCSGWIRVFNPADSTAAGFATGIGSLVDLKVGIDGYLYYLAQGNGGEVWQVRSTAGPVSISGNVVSCTDPNSGPIPDVTFTLTGSVSGSALSDASGIYLLSPLDAGGSYTVTPSKPPLLPASNGITTVDVVAGQRHFLNVVLLTGCSLAAADVNGDAMVNTVDVIAIQRFYLGLSTGIANTGTYQFAPLSRSYAGLATSQLVQGYTGFVYGDIAAPFAD